MIDRRSLRLIAAAAAAPLLLACAKKTAPPPQAVPVTVGKVELRTVPYVLQANGTVEPMQTVAIEPQVGGIITRILFKEGDDVKEGQPLFEIDPRSYQATLDQAQAVVERDRAQLASANSDVSRYSALVDKNYVTSQQMEQVKTTAASLKATLASDEAAAQQARLNLQYATIRAPISGRAGSLQVRVGLSGARPRHDAARHDQSDPSDPGSLRRAGGEPAAHPAVCVDRLAGERAPASSPGAASTGTLSFVDNAIDTTTGTILLKGTFENKDGALWPGEFVTASLQLFQQQNAIVVPTQAVVEGQNGNFLFVINADSTATQREITDRPCSGRRHDHLAGRQARRASGDRRPAATEYGDQGSDQAARRRRSAEAGMSISEPFIKRPVMTTLVMAGILLFGIVSYRNLAVSDLPTVDYPTVSVSASLPGASPETMASSVATPLEKQFSTIAGIDAMTSQSALGTTSITLQFALDRNIDAAAADVQAAISQTLRQLPQNIVPPSYQKVDPSAIARSSTSRCARRRCRCRSSTNTPRRSSRSASRWCPASRRCRCTARRSTPCASSSIRRPWRRGRSGSTRSPMR